MIPYKKIMSILLAFTGTAALLLLAAVLLAPRFLDPESIKERVSEEICRTASCDISYEQLTVSMWPTPRVTVTQGSFDLEEHLVLTWNQLLVVPRLRSLLRGEMHISKIIVDTPTLEAPAAKTVDELPLPPEDPPPLHLPEKISSIFKDFPQMPHPFQAVIQNGSVKLWGKDGTSYEFWDLQSHIRVSRAKYDVDIRCESNLARQVSLKGSAQPGPMEFQVTGEVMEAKPSLMQEFFPSGFPSSAPESSVNLQFHFQGDGQKTLKGNLEAFSPQWKLMKENSELSLVDAELKGNFQWEPDRMEVTLSRLHLQNPRSTFQGNYRWDASQKDALLHIEGTNMEAAPVREAALFIWESHPVVQGIFKIVLAGDVPLITFHSTADLPRELGSTKNFVLEGEMRDGTVLVPSAELLVREAFGKVRVENGNLECRDLRGVTPGSSGEKGYLLITLKGDGEPFHFHMDLEADLSELGPVLERVVPNKGFLEELSLFKDVEGTGRGKLTLGDSLKHVRVKVELDAYQLSSHYQRLSHPFTARGNHFLLEDERVSVHVSSGTVGRSSLAGVRANVDWKERTMLEVSLEEPSSLDLDQFYPWLLSHGTVKERMESFPAFKGTLQVEKLEFKGPATSPENWQFQVEGQAADFVMEATFLPSALAVSRGSFRADHRDLRVRDARSRLLDASVHMNGTFHGYTRGLPGVELQIAGELGKDANGFVMDLTDMPRELRIAAPYRVEQSKISWNDEGKVSFDGNVSWNPGAKASLKFHRTEEFLNIERISIGDGQSDVTASVFINLPEVRKEFRGTLQHSTLDRILEENQLLQGNMAGNMKARLLLDEPILSTFDGYLQVSHFQVIWGLQSPVIIEKATVNASENRLQITDMEAAWKDSHFHAQGHLLFAKPHLEVDLDVEAESIHWAQVLESLPSEDHETSWDGHVSWGDSTLAGIVRLQAKEFTREPFTFNSLEAHIHLEPDGLRIQMLDATLCGLSTQGTLQPFQDQYRLEVDLLAAGSDLSETISCLWGENGLATGTYDLQGRLQGSAPLGAIAQFLAGELDFKARNGRIQRFTLLSRIFSVINITEFYRGHFPDWRKEGLAYDSMEGKLHVDGEIIRVDEFVLDGPYLKMVIRGNMNLATRKLDLIVLLSPLRTADRIIDMLPLVGHIMGGSLILIPVGVEGDMDNPTIIPLPPGAVGSEILGYIKRIFNAPLRLIQPGL